MDVKLYINDTLVDLPEDAGRLLRLDKGGVDVADIGARTADHSYSFTLPLTRANDALFSGRSDIQATDKFFSASPYRARLEAGGRVLLQGLWRHSRISGGYHGMIVSEEVDVFTLIGERTLREISSFAAFDYRGQHSFPELLHQTAGKADLCWPLVAYGNFFAPQVLEGVDVPPSSQLLAPIEVDDYTPSVYYTSVIRHIFESVGWQAVGEPLQDPFFAQLCLPHVGEEYRWNWGELLKLDAYTEAPTAIDYSTAQVEEPTGWADHYWVLQPQEVYNPARRYRQDAALPGASTYSVRREGGYDISLSFNLDSFSFSVGVYFELYVQLRRVPYGALLGEGEVVRELKLNSGGNVAAGRYSTEQLGSAPVYLAPTERLVPVLLLRIPGSAPKPGSINISVSQLRFTLSPAEAEVGPSFIDIAANLPELNCREFVKSFLLLGNLRHVVDSRRKTISFHYRDRYELPADFAVDVTGLADPEVCEAVPATTARRFLFEYADDASDALLQQQRGFANKVHDSRNANAEGDQTLDLPFAATVQRQYLLGDRSVLLPCMATTDQLNAPLNTVHWEYGYTPRLLRYTGPSAPEQTLPLAFMGGEHLYGTASMEGLTWEEVYQRHYRGYLAEIVRGHLLKGTFALSADAFQRLHPARPVLFAGNLYRLNKVSGFQVAADSPTAELELLHVVREAVGGGKPKDAEAELGKEFYEGEFYPGEWY